VLDLACALVGDDAGASNLEEERPIDAWGIEHLVEPYDPDWLRALPPDGHALHPLDHQRMITGERALGVDQLRAVDVRIELERQHFFGVGPLPERPLLDHVLYGEWIGKDRCSCAE
jgi:hypothetical protein